MFNYEPWGIIKADPNQLATMQDLKKLKLTTLVDLLDKYTNDFLKMPKTGARQEEYDAHKNIIRQLTHEIESRQKEKPDTEEASA